MKNVDALIASLVGLLIVAVMVALVARRLKLPYTVGLVASGIVLAWTRLDGGVALTRDFIYLVILPPLLFEAALFIHWRELRRDFLPILVLSTVGVVISALVVGLGMTWLHGWPLTSALVLGVLIAATDPVAVIALFKDVGLKGRLRLLVESESLFNDGVAAVLFALTLAWAMAPASPPTVLTALASLGYTAGGGILVGLLVGGAAIALAGRTLDHLISAAITTVAAYGAFLLAEHFHASGVLATVTAGLVIGNVDVLGGRSSFTAAEHEFVRAFWDFAAFIANSIIFLMIGLAVAALPFEWLGAVKLATVIFLVLLGRIFTVYPLSLAFARSRWAIDLRSQHVLWWGGLRGALALALALSLPASLPYAGQIRVAAFAVVAFSVLVQGLSMKPLLRRLGLT